MTAPSDIPRRAELIRLHHLYRATTIYVTHDQVEAMTLGDRIAVIDAGRLQQIGAPHDLYHRPANVFVAGFIGSPSMNLVQARLLPGDPPVLAVDEHRWPLNAAHLEHRPDLAHYVGGTVTVGLRPTAFALPAPADGPTMTVTVTGIEALGYQSYLLFEGPSAAEDRLEAAATGTHADESAKLWTARIEARVPVNRGDRVTLGVQFDQAYFFDPVSGATIQQVSTPQTALV